MASQDYDGTVNRVLEHRYIHHLGKQCYMFDSSFQDTIYIHIRELAYRDGQQMPIAKGIALTLNFSLVFHVWIPKLASTTEMRTLSTGDIWEETGS